MRLALALAAVIAVAGCEAKDARTPAATGSTSATATAPTTSGSAAARPPLDDLVGADALAPVRTAFNAHKGEIRFLTLLSPT
jgi:hypothetical protein